MTQKLADRVIEEMPWLDPVADTVQATVAQGVQAGGPPAQAAKDFLNGRWLGHPLHPALVAVPIGAWTGTLVLDVLDLEDGADAMLALGIAAATGAALAGLADWSDLSGPDRRMGLLHALLNTAGLSLNVVSLALRRRGARAPGVALSTLAFGVATVSGFLGGELSYTRGVGVNRTAWDMAPTDWTVALEESALQENTPVRGEANGVPVVLVKQGADLFALDATCTHVGGPLNEGTVEGDIIQCPWHGSQFCLRDGSTRRGPATVPALRFETRIRDGNVEVRRAD